MSRHLPREEREQRFVERIHTAVARGGRVLLPVVALGRAQELLLILEEYWERHPELHGVPIYQVGRGCGAGQGGVSCAPQPAAAATAPAFCSCFPARAASLPCPRCCDASPALPPLLQASGLARRAISVYQAYIEMMNDDIKAAFNVANPFQFKHISHLKSAAQFDDVGPCVVMATPSMLQVRCHSSQLLWLRLSQWLRLTMACTSASRAAATYVHPSTIHPCIVLPIHHHACTLHTHRAACRGSCLRRGAKTRATASSLLTLRCRYGRAGWAGMALSTSNSQDMLTFLPAGMPCCTLSAAMANCCFCFVFMQGTLARDILGNPAEVMTRNGVKVGRQHVVALACWYGSNGSTSTLC